MKITSSSKLIKKNCDRLTVFDQESHNLNLSTRNQSPINIKIAAKSKSSSKRNPAKNNKLKKNRITVVKSQSNTKQSRAKKNQRAQKSKPGINSLNNHWSLNLLISENKGFLAQSCCKVKQKEKSKMIKTSI